VHEQLKEKPLFTRDQIEFESSIKARDNILARFSTTTLFGRYASNPPKRGPFGEAEIGVKNGNPPVGRPAFRLGDERLKRHTTLIREGIKKGNMEPGLSEWNLP